MPEREARNSTYQESRGPVPGAAELALIWTPSLVHKLLAAIWAAYDDLVAGEWNEVDWTQDYEDLERDLSEALATAIDDRLDRLAGVSVQHGPFERESRKKAPAQPPQYDIAFKWRAKPRIMWPIEAKVVRSDANTDADLRDYADTMRDRYLTSKYAPFSHSASMVAYLRSGDSEIVLKHISSRIDQRLVPEPNFGSRPHGTSDHMRSVPKGKDYPQTLRIHHLVFRLSPE